MKKILIAILILTVMLFSAGDSLRISYPRLAIAGTATVGAMAGAYFVVQNAWWSEASEGFHFDDGFDMKYAKNLDKAAHMFGGYVSQDLYYRSLIWSNLDRKRALIWSAGLSCFVQVMIDVKDGYSPKWGFSYWDVGAGAAGAGYGAAQKIWPVLENYDLKFSYFYRDDNYPSETAPRTWAVEDFIEDYPNQIYWLTANINSLLPEKAGSFIPDCLGIAVGLSGDDIVENRRMSGDYELYFSLDIDLEKLVSPLNNVYISSIAHYLNYIKMPMPTLRFYPSAKGYLIYM